MNDEVTALETILRSATDADPFQIWKCNRLLWYHGIIVGRLDAAYRDERTASAALTSARNELQAPPPPLRWRDILKSDPGGVSMTRFQNELEAQGRSSKARHAVRDETECLKRSLESLRRMARDFGQASWVPIYSALCIPPHDWAPVLPTTDPHYLSIPSLTREYQKLFPFRSPYLSMCQLLCGDGWMVPCDDIEMAEAFYSPRAAEYLEKSRAKVAADDAAAELARKEEEARNARAQVLLAKLAHAKARLEREKEKLDRLRRNT